MAFSIVRIAAIVMLFVALDKQPHEYYVAMRYVLLATALFGIYRAHKHKKQPWLFVFGAMALLYNPVHHFKLGKENWVPLNMIVAMVLILSFYLVREGKPMHTRVAPPADGV